MFLVEAVGDVAARVARHVDDAGAGGAKFHDVAFADRAVDAGNEVLLAFGPDHHAARLLLEFGIAARMVEMVMRVQDVGERPSLFLEGGEDRLHLRRVDRRRRAGSGLVDEIAVIVVQTGKLVNFKLCHLVSSGNTGFSGPFALR